MRARLKSTADRATKELARAAYPEGLIELKEIKRRTPIEFGALVGSEEMELVVTGKNVYVRFRAGGPAAPYAYWVHENPEAEHPVGQWKYMESVINEVRAHWAARIARRIDMNRVVGKK